MFSERELKDAGGHATLSRRHLQNRAHALRARRRLTGLWWWEEVCEGLDLPQCVLCELGRMEGVTAFEEAAWWYRYSGRNLSAKLAAQGIKEMRTGITPQEGPVTLYRRLMRTVGDFRTTYPAASLLYQEGQVELVLRTIRQARH